MTRPRRAVCNSGIFFRKRLRAPPGAVVVAGGVAANALLRQVLKRLCAEAGLRMIAPPRNLCTDNGAMIAWAGMCPGNNESAGKRKSGRTTKGSRWLRQVLTQAAWAASHTKDTYLASQYRRLEKMGHQVTLKPKEDAA